jgi:hypothetical protein
MNMRRPLSLAIHPAALAALVAMAMAPASADPSSDLMNAVVATMNASSYHITMTSPGTGVSEGDIVKPGKMHMITKGAESIVIGTTMYIKISGKWKKIDGSGFSMDPSAEIKKMQAHRSDYTASDLGMRPVGGVPYHAYLVTNNKKHTKETIYVDSAGRLARVETSGITMTFSKYGENVAIVPPM